MSSTSTSATFAAVSAYEREAVQAMQSGREDDAFRAWSQVLALQPQHAVALTQVGQTLFKRGDFIAARQAFAGAADTDGSKPRAWVNLALACQQLGDTTAEAAALTGALQADPYDLLALVLRGSMFERLGQTQQAVSAFGAAAAVAPPLDRLTPELRPAVTHAMQFCEQHHQALGRFVDNFMAPHLQGVSGTDTARFKLSLDILLGRKQRFDAQPMRYFVPQLPVVEFFERSLFPWMDAVDAAFEPIRDEFLAVLKADQDHFQPYITYNKEQPVAQWAELNHSPRWSAFHLQKEGCVVSDNASRCPLTMAAISQAPRPDQPGRTPVAMFSLLKPKTRIPPHVGASNARLVTHLPLIVPPGCSFRVGNTTRAWTPGKTWVFDDTIEHEAHNPSDELRVVLIFDVWHPGLNAEERRLITAMNAALNAFSADAAVDYDV